MSFAGSGIRLSDTDLPRIGMTIGCGEDELHAFLDVETNGGGWDKVGRPKSLLEPHKVYANAARVSPALLDRFVKAGLAYPTWGAKPYPPDSYPRILAGIEIDERVTLLSTSWGIGQIMGENFLAAGYQSVRQMVDAFVQGGEPEQLAAAVRFIKANHLDDELRAHNWAAFARGYNGPKYAANAYDKKLAAAFKKWAAIRDTPWAPPLPETLRMALDSTPTAPVVVVPVQSPAAPIVLPSKAAPRPGIIPSKASPPPPPPDWHAGTPVGPPISPPPSFLSRLRAWANRSA